MKLLLDTCVSPRTRDTLASAGHDVVWLQADVCGQVLARHAQELLAGAIATVTRGRVRLRPPAGSDSAEGQKADRI